MAPSETDYIYAFLPHSQTSFTFFRPTSILLYALLLSCYSTSKADAATAAIELEKRNAKLRLERDAAMETELAYIDEMIDAMKLNEEEEDVNKQMEEYYCAACRKRFR